MFSCFGWQSCKPCPASLVIASSLIAALLFILHSWTKATRSPLAGRDRCTQRTVGREYAVAAREEEEAAAFIKQHVTKPVVS
jgi:hypothetical protein